MLWMNFHEVWGILDGLDSRFVGRLFWGYSTIVLWHVRSMCFFGKHTLVQIFDYKSCTAEYILVQITASFISCLMMVCFQCFDTGGSADATATPSLASAKSRMVYPSGTDSTGWSRTKGRKTAVVVVVVEMMV